MISSSSGKKTTVHRKTLNVDYTRCVHCYSGCEKIGFRGQLRYRRISQNRHYFALKSNLQLDQEIASVGLNDSDQTFESFNRNKNQSRLWHGQKQQTLPDISTLAQRKWPEVDTNIGNSPLLRPNFTATPFNRKSDEGMVNDEPNSKTGMLN